MHGEWAPADDRPDPVSLLEEQATSRVPELVPLRYGRMLVSPFTFYRGAAYLMASDLAGAPRSGLTVQLCGDAHLSNFGTYASPDRRLVFSLNDFDETLPGPFEWDVKRLAASFAVAGRDRGFDDAQRERVNLAVGESYRQSIGELAGMRKMDVWYSRLDVDQIETVMADQLKAGQLKRFRKNVAKAQSKDSLKAFNKLVRTVDGRPRLVGDPPLIVPLSELFPDLELHHLEDALRDLLRSYRRSLRGDHRHLIEGFRFGGAARKVVGVGSVGTRAWIVLMLGNHDGDPLLLQAKEAEASVLEPFLGRSKHVNHGQRVVEGQRLMQSASDVLLGWIKSSGPDGVTRDYYIRQLWDGKGSAVIEAMKPSAMAATPGSVAGRSPAPMPGPATRSPSRATSAPETGSTALSHASPRPTPTRTSGTTQPSRRPSRPDASKPSPTPTSAFAGGPRWSLAASPTHPRPPRRTHRVNPSPRPPWPSLLCGRPRTGRTSRVRA